MDCSYNFNSYTIICSKTKRSTRKLAKITAKWIYRNASECRTDEEYHKTKKKRGG